MVKRIVRRTSAQVRDELALLEVLEPVEEAHLAAKEAYTEARALGNAASIREARQAKVDTGNKLNEIRTWLRREQAIVKLQTKTIPELEARLSRPILTADGNSEDRARLQAALERAKAELAVISAEAAAYRRELEALGGVVGGEPVPPNLPPGSADVSLPSVTVRPVVNARKRRA